MTDQGLPRPRSSTPFKIWEGKLDLQHRKRTKPEMSPSSCARCNTMLCTTTKHVECSNCHLPYCNTCTGMRDIVIQMILEDEDTGMTWKCLPCNSTAPTLENINQTLSHLCIQNDKRMEKMEDRVSKLETKTRETIHEEVVKSKSDIVGLMKEDIISIAQQRIGRTKEQSQ